ncbi:MAG: MBL fold metallo-hydrolase [Pseudomonadota bacterium]
MQIAEQWFERRTLSNNITLITEPFVSPLLRCNIWHVRGRHKDLLVDTGLGVTSLRPAIEDLLEHPVLAVATHSHFDHTGGLNEFDEVAAHPAELDELTQPTFGTLTAADLPRELLDEFATAGYAVEDLFIDALPSADYDPESFKLQPVNPTQLIEEGDVLDIGDRHFEVLHLPGHSPGSIGLWERSSATLFSGDAIYDGPLLDFLPESDVAAYIDTMKRLKTLNVDVVHGGHEPSFGRSRLIEIVDAFLQRHDAF